MHEASIAAPLLSLALDELSRHSDGDLVISRIDIRCGLLMGIEPVTLQGCFTIMAEGTPAEKAELVLEILPMSGHCSDCGEDVSTGQRAFACPLCNSARVKWEGGNELYISSLKVRSKD